MTRFRIIYQNSNIEAPQGRFDIGRSLECNLVLDDPSVSRFHATIVREDNVLLLEDRGSRNGCTKNGLPVTGTVRLADGDVIGIGHQTIRIAAITEQKHHASSTMGLIGCPNCGKWVSMGDDFCNSCGGPMHQNGDHRPSDTAQIDLPTQRPDGDTTGVPALHSGQMLAGLAQKALGKNRPDEAWKLTRRLMDAIASPREPGRESPEVELEAVAMLLIEVAIQTKDPGKISELFSFFGQIKRLLPRKSVDQLYATARNVGYRTSSELYQYVACMAEMVDTFSPGDKFIFRRIEGLTGLCN